MKKIITILAVAAALVLSSGCAFKQYSGPTSGRSADYQLTVAKASQVAFEKVNFDKLKGETVFVEVNGLSGKYSKESSEEGYIRAEIFSKLSQAGATVVEEIEKADIRISTRLRIAGVNTTDRHLPAIYYSVSHRGVVSAHMAIYDRKEGKLIDSIEANGAVRYTEIFLFYIFGPIRLIKPIKDQSADPGFWKAREAILPESG